MSNWEARPLRVAQLCYAAMDAWACSAIHAHLVRSYPELNAAMSNQAGQKGGGLLKNWHQHLEPSK